VPLRLAFDVGGTFTDFVIEDVETGELAFGKSLTTHADLAGGVIEALGGLLDESRARPADLVEIVHATTVAANAIIERKGARTGLVTNEGFRDVLLIGREKRSETYDLKQAKPPPLVPRRLVATVAGRLDAAGLEVEPLDEDSVRRAAKRLLTERVESVAVSLLHSYADPRHEDRARALLRREGLDVTLSSEVSPRRGEYERTSTAVANAYVKPIVARYLAQIGRAFAGRGVGARLFVMQSNGGVSTPELVTEQPVRIVESGPAAGVLMAAEAARRCGFGDLITLDMGGTTAKVGTVHGGQPATTDSFEIAGTGRRGAGLPLNIPVVELLEIGAGGGSIARTRLGTVEVGPASAGSDPGPVCYGRGGAQVTVTDANLVLGYLDPAYFLGGRMRLDAEAARAALRRQIGEPLGLAPGEDAWGVHAVAGAGMERAMRIMSIERGRDPRRYSLIAFGGAGPLHAARLARGLAIPRVLVPVGAGVGSAIGLLGAEMRFDLTQSRLLPLTEEAGPQIVEAYRDLRRRAIRQFRLEEASGLVWSHMAWIRYRGQGHEIAVPLPTEGTPSRLLEAALDGFDDAYRRAYGYSQPGSPTEAVHWGVTVRLPSPRRRAGGYAAAEGRALKGTRPTWFPEAGGYTDCAVWDRYRLRPGARLEGPAVVEERESTTVVPPGDTATVDEHGTLVIETAAP
jgi:N-methylhydantoinase A